MGKLHISGTNGVYDGQWDFDGELTNGEYHRIFTLTGIAGAELWEAISKGNVGVYCALAAVVLERNGKFVDYQVLLDSTEIPTLGAEPSSDGGAKKQSSGRSSKAASAS
jgi:hypothetical protein